MQLLASVSWWKLGFVSRLVHMGFVVDKVACKVFFLSVSFHHCPIIPVVHLCITIGI
jgi:hypothetical protein